LIITALHVSPMVAKSCAVMMSFVRNKAQIFNCHISRTAWMNWYQVKQKYISFAFTDFLATNFFSNS